MSVHYDKSRYSNVDKRVFPSLLKRIVESDAFSRSNTVNAFEACGIFQLNWEKIGGDKISTAVPLTQDTAVVQTKSEDSQPTDEQSNNVASGCQSTNDLSKATDVSSPPVNSPRK